MEVSREENRPPPPGIINSIRAGFDAIASRLTAIIFPLLLNLFLWLGPRLRMDALFNSLKSDMVAIWQSGGISAEDIQRALDWYNSTIPNINLFWLLRTIPIGISSLPFMQDAKTPLGTPAVFQVGAFGLFGWMFLLILTGWIGGGLYFRGVARLAVNDDALRLSIPRAIIQTIFLSVLWGILIVMIAMPVMLMVAVLNQISATLASLLILFLSIASTWAIVPLYFWSHGIFVRKENALVSMLSSWKLTRFMLPASSMFVLAVFLLAFGLNFLWSVPPEDSWMTLIGILGHSFVTTALLAGSFIYYRDVNVWLQAALEKINADKLRRQTGTKVDK